jgi:hypothetical protein
MTEMLDVLVVESHPGVGAAAVKRLEAAGHRVHRCYDDRDRGFPCRGLATPSACPIEGHVDVALAMRTGFAPAPTHFEEGVPCAIRAGIPIVEHGSDARDPFSPWVSMHLVPGDDVVSACTEAVEQSFDPLRQLVASRIAKLLVAASIDPDEVSSRFDVTGSAVDVHLDLPTVVSRAIEQALAVRVLDAVRASGRTYSRVDVHVHKRPCRAASR